MVVTADWKEVRLGEIAEIISGGTPSTAIGSYWGGDIPWCTPTDITSCKSNYLFETERKITPAGLAGSAASLLPPGSLLLCTRATVGDVRIAGRAIATNQGFKSLVVNSQANSKFVYFVLQTLRPAMIEKSSGSTFLELGKNDLSNIVALMPPLKEQEVIAEALSDADAAIESLDALITKKRDMKQATMQQLLTGRTRMPGFTADWIGVRLGDLGSTFGGLTGKSSKDFGEGNASFVTFMNVMSNVVLNNQGTEKVRIGNGERQSQLLEGDVIFNGSSETPEEVGFGSAVPIELSGLYLNSFCFGFRRKDTKSLDPKFFAYLTRSPLGRDIIRPMAQGSTRYNIAKTNLLNGRFPLPPLKEQEAIAEVLTVMDDELKALTEQVSKLRMVKEGMMQDLLTGKVRLV